MESGKEPALEQQPESEKAKKTEENAVQETTANVTNNESVPNVEEKTESAPETKPIKQAEPNKEVQSESEETKAKETQSAPDMANQEDGVVKPKPHKESEEDKEFKKVVSHMPSEVMAKFVALKYIADKRKEIADQLEEEINALERKFDLDCVPLDDLREELVNGKREPTEEELASLNEYNEPHPDSPVPDEIDIEKLKESKGVPGFWKTAMRNSEELIRSITDEDAKVLEYLTDIRKENLEGRNYRLVFKFAPNEYFTNQELTKTIKMSEGVDEYNETEGTEIDWKEGKNITKKIIKKKQKNKKTKAVREVTKTVDIDSFFNYFKSNKAPTKEEEEMMEMEDDEENEKAIAGFHNDMSITEELTEEVIPQAVYFYFGIIDDNDHSSDEDEDDDSDKDQKDSHKKAGKRKSSDEGEPAAKKECKQQ
jgi:nucleosome assembly protein 1-like 1